MKNPVSTIPYTHLNVHSYYSKGWGIPALEELCTTAQQHHLTHIALTDTNGLYGAIFFIEAARDVGLKPILGSEIVHGGHRALLLVKTLQDYANLSRIVSDRHCDQEFDLVRTLKDHREGLIVLSDDECLLNVLNREGHADLFVEISPGYEMSRCEAFSRRTGIPPVATNRVYFLREEDFALHRILRAVSMNGKVSRLTKDDVCREHNFFTSPADMVQWFPHAPAAVENTYED